MKLIAAFWSITAKSVTLLCPASYLWEEDVFDLLLFTVSSLPLLSRQSAWVPQTQEQGTWAGGKISSKVIRKFSIRQRSGNFYKAIPAATGAAH